jgi:flagellar assembly factor FliW
MLIQSRYFGEIEVDDNTIITFEEGIFGFSNYHRFAIIYDNEFFCWLQSVEDKEVALPMIQTTMIFTDYCPEVDDNMILKIGELNQEDLLIYTIVVVPENIENMTTNLKAPIIVNTKTNKGIQVILNEEYEVKHNLYDYLKQVKQKAGE